MLHQLGSFQGEIGRHILKLSKYHSTLSTRLALRWPSVTARMFVRKLSLLSKVADEGNSIGSQAHHKILSGSYSNVELWRVSSPVRALPMPCSVPSQL